MYWKFEDPTVKREQIARDDQTVREQGAKGDRSAKEGRLYVDLHGGSVQEEIGWEWGKAETFDGWSK